MVKTDKDTVRRLAALCRIHCTPQEEEELLEGLQKILNYVDRLDEIDTENVSPCDHVIAGMVNVEREDEVGPVLDTQTFLQNAPAHVGGMIRVPPVIKNHIS